MPGHLDAGQRLARHRLHRVTPQFDDAADKAAIFEITHEAPP
jgi:hypothetical protein